VISRRLPLLLVLLSSFFTTGFFFSNEEAAQLKIQSGLEAFELENYAEAYHHWKEVADKGHPEAQYHIGWLYANGYGVNVDVPMAMSWWEKAAAQNHAPSQFALGMVYMTGDGKTIKKNVKEAIRWHMESAENGSVDGQEMMRQLYQTRKSAVLKQYPDIAKKPWFKPKKPAK
jgi:TPR repeat protein